MSSFKKLVIISIGLILVTLHLLSVDANIIPKLGKRVVCYYGSWAVYRPGNGKFDVGNIDPFICTHLIYTFAGLSNDGKIIPLDSWNDEEGDYRKGAFRRFTNLKQLNPKLKTLLAIGGWNEGSNKYSLMAATTQTRRIFIDSLFPLLEQYNFDGLDLDWEYPASRGGNPEDKANFAVLCREIRPEFDQRGWLLTAAVSASEFTIKDAYDIPSISRSFDFINVMTYDFHGAWEPFTGHHSPLGALPTENGNITKLNLKYAIEYWISQGAPPSKLNIGLSAYGRGFILGNPSGNGIYAPAPQALPAGPFTRTPGFWGYNEICERLNVENWTVVTDQYGIPHAYFGNLWIGYDNSESFSIKSNWALGMGLGGVMVWSIETDDFHGICGETNVLIKTIYRTTIGEIPAPPRVTLPYANLTTTETTQNTTEVKTFTPPPSEKCQFGGQIVAERCDKFFSVCNWKEDNWIEKIYPCLPGLSHDSTLMQCNFDDIVGC